MLTNPDCYRLAFSAIEDGVWESDPSTGLIQWDARCYEMLGYPADAFPVTPESWQLPLHPVDLRQTEYAMHVQLQENAAFQCQFRLRTVDDSWRWIESRGRIVDWEEGRATRIVGVHTDISARKEAELELQQSQRKISALVASMTDTLTGLPNRRSFMERLDEEYARFQRFSTPTALLMLDGRNRVEVADIA